MTQRQIAAKVAKLKAKMQKCTNEIIEVQTTCLHPNVIKKHGADTGNWWPGDNRYWTEFKCPDCDKRWTEEGSK